MAAPQDDLTDRERDILRLIALGYTNQEIAGQLYLSVRTIEAHRRHILGQAAPLHARRSGALRARAADRRRRPDLILAGCERLPRRRSHSIDIAATRDVPEIAHGRGASCRTTHARVGPSVFPQIRIGADRDVPRRTIGDDLTKSLLGTSASDVREAIVMSEPPLVVVGVDGSSCSLEALRFAADEATRRGAHLRIVSAWSVPTMAYAGGLAAGVDSTVFREAAEAASATAVEQARHVDAALVIDAVVPEQSPTTALLEAAKGADLLVVGSRGHGGLREPAPRLGEHPARTARAVPDHDHPLRYRSLDSDQRPTDAP